MSKKARAKKKQANRSSGTSSVRLSATWSVPEPEVSTIRLHDAALDEETPSIIPPATLILPVVPAKPAKPATPDDEAVSVAFFEAPNSPSLAPVEFDLDDENDPLAIRRLSLTPAGVARRAQLGRYVAAAVGLAALVGVAGAVRGRSAREAMSATMSVAALSERPALAAASPAKVQAAAVVQPATLPAPVAVPVPVVPAPAEEVKKVEEAKTPELDPVQAKKEKNASRNALEAGKNVKAIEAGERSVALDPTDAEAWLILGAAYQTKGNNAEAKRCFKSCLTEGKRGPKGECAAMAR